MLAQMAPAIRASLLSYTLRRGVEWRRGHHFSQIGPRVSGHIAHRHGRLGPDQAGDDVGGVEGERSIGVCREGTHHYVANEFLVARRTALPRVGINRRDVLGENMIE